jgi:hypothetical protein
MIDLGFYLTMSVIAPLPWVGLRNTIQALRRKAPFLHRLYHVDQAPSPSEAKSSRQAGGPPAPALVVTMEQSLISVPPKSFQ